MGAGSSTPKAIVRRGDPLRFHELCEIRKSLGVSGSRQIVEEAIAELYNLILDHKGQGMLGTEDSDEYDTLADAVIRKARQKASAHAAIAKAPVEDERFTTVADALRDVHGTSGTKSASDWVADLETELRPRVDVDFCVDTGLCGSGTVYTDGPPPPAQPRSDISLQQLIKRSAERSLDRETAYAITDPDLYMYVFTHNLAEGVRGSDFTAEWKPLDRAMATHNRVVVLWSKYSDIETARTQLRKFYM